MTERQIYRLSLQTEFCLESYYAAGERDDTSDTGGMQCPPIKMPLAMVLFSATATYDSHVLCSNRLCLSRPHTGLRVGQVRAIKN